MTNSSINRFAHTIWLLVVLALTACVYSASDTGDQRSSSDIQSIRASVLESFFSDPQGSVNKYRNKWITNKYGSDRAGDAEKLAASGQLMRRDSANMKDYYAYVNSKINDQDSEIQSLAVAALADAGDIASLDVLVEKANSRHVDVAREAVNSLEYRYDSSRSGSGDKEVLKIVIDKVEGLCKATQNKNSQLKSFCSRITSPG